MLSTLARNGDSFDEPINSHSPQSFLNSTLVDHQQNGLAIRFPWEMETRAFLGDSHGSLSVITTLYPDYDLPQLHRAVRACFPDWQILREFGPPTSQHEPVRLPMRSSIEMKP